ncbi:electron carrier [Blastocladiella emersonii ATCC 22665]|nr:electron carrier [Blastocladiella emersonii ATCC 22665]
MVSAISTLGLRADASVLLVGNAFAEPRAIEALAQDLKAAVSAGSVAFEQLDRIPTITLKAATYTDVVTGYASSVVPHPTATLGKLLQALKPGGRLHVREIAFAGEGAFPIEGVRSVSQLVSHLKLSGFVNASSTPTPLSTEEAERVLAQWGVPAAQTTSLAKQLVLLEATAEKPSYEVGAMAALPLSFRKRKPAAAPAAPVVDKVALWTTAQDDADVINEDDLLDEDDLAKPAPELLSRPSNCETKRKACKNCSCGRAEMEAAEAAEAASKPVLIDDINEHPITNVVPPTVKSSCGNCYLGDAFRCASCPYLGMPAFKPGEQVVLAGNMMNDDIDF